MKSADIHCHEFDEHFEISNIKMIWEITCFGKLYDTGKNRNYAKLIVNASREFPVLRTLSTIKFWIKD